MASRPGTLPFNLAIATGNTPVTELSTNFSFLLGILNDSGAGWTTEAVDTGTTNNLIVSLPSPPVSYQAGMMLCVVPSNTNTGPAVINVNALGNQAIVNPASIPLNGGEMSKNALVPLIYDGTNFRVAGVCPLNLSLLGLNASQNVECAGATSIFINAQWTSGASLTLAMNHVSYGVPISFILGNSTGATSAFSIGMTDPAGSLYTVINTAASGSSTGVPFTSIRAGTGSVTLTNGTAMFFIGSSVSALNAFFSH